MAKKVLLMYISESSGHHRACLAIEKALKLKGEDIETLNVNAFNYTNPILEKIIGKTYMSVIRRKPQFWGYLYDNPTILKKTQRLRDSIHKHNTEKLRHLIGDYKPDAVICTQAFPCGMVADYKRTYNDKTRLFGVLTDYAPHSYWIYDKVDAYFVPCAETGDKLINNGVPSQKIIKTGIPIDPIFKTAKNKTEIINKLGFDKEKPIILLMGGSQGIGPMREVFTALLKTNSNIQVLAIAGTNRNLFRWFKRHERKAAQSGKKLFAYPFVDNTDELMEASTLLISKPGGITTAEAFAKGLPLLIIKPIPGQEQMNADYLVKNNVAIKMEQPQDAAVLVEELLYNYEKLEELRMRIRAFSKPYSAQNIASFILANIT